MKEPAIRTRKNRSGKTVYFIDYYTPDGDRKRITVGTRKEQAEKVRAKVYNDLIGGKFDLPTDSFLKLSLPELIDLLLKSKDNRNAKTTISKYRAGSVHLLNFFKTSFPSIKVLTQIKQVHLEAHLQDFLKNGHQESTANGQLRFLKVLFNYAVDAGHLKESPTRKIQRFKVKKEGTIEYWAEDELMKIFATVADHWRDPIQFLYLTGLRKGELIHLTWNDVILENDHGAIVIQSKEGWETKNSRSRQVPLCPDALAIIRRCKRHKEHKWVFTGKNGGQVHPDRIYHSLKTALKKLKLTGTIHQLRHTFASHLVMKGVGIETVSRLMGHADIKTTMIYAHLAPDYLQQAVEKLKIKSSTKSP